MLNNPGQVDAYLIHRTTDMDEDDVQNLAQDIEIIPQDRLADVTDFVEKKVAESIQEYEAGQYESRRKGRLAN